MELIVSREGSGSLQRLETIQTVAARTNQAGNSLLGDYL